MRFWSFGHLYWYAYESASLDPSSFGANFDAQWTAIESTARAVKSLRPLGTFWRVQR